MRPTPLRRLDTLARQMVPFASSLAIVVCGTVPFHVSAIAIVSTSLSLIAVFYWSLYRPDLMPAVAAFGIGLFQDTLMALPLGVSALVLVAVHAIVVTQRRFFLGKPFAIVWLGFALIAFAAISLSWMVISAYYGTLIAWPKIVLQMLMVVGWFPLLVWLLSRCQLSLLRQV